MIQMVDAGEELPESGGRSADLTLAGAHKYWD